MGVFIDPSTDWGFKRIFGDKELLVNFLNSLLEGERVITNLKYMNNERVPRLKDERKVITTFIARLIRVRTSLWRCRNGGRNILRIEPYTIPPVPSTSKETVVSGTTN